MNPRKRTLLNEWVRAQELEMQMSAEGKEEEAKAYASIVKKIHFILLRNASKERRDKANDTK